MGGRGGKVRSMGEGQKKARAGEGEKELVEGAQGGKRGRYVRREQEGEMKEARCEKKNYPFLGRSPRVSPSHLSLPSALPPCPYSTPFPPLPSLPLRYPLLLTFLPLPPGRNRRTGQHPRQ